MMESFGRMDLTAIAILGGRQSGNALKYLAKMPRTGEAAGIGDLMHLRFIAARQHLFCPFDANSGDVIARRATQALSEAKFERAAGNIELLPNMAKLSGSVRWL